MAIVSVIYGRSGTGKSYSLKNFGPDEILHINVERKPLPFKGKFTYSGSSATTTNIIEQMKKAAEKGIKIMVVDDATYIMIKKFMSKHREMKGNSQFDLYNDIADSMYFLIEQAKELPDDVTVYIILHEQETQTGSTKVKTIGKLLDDKCPIAEAITIMLRCMTDGRDHWFQTQNDGNDETKSPEGMFQEKMLNDLKAVDDAIRGYYDIEIK